MSDQNGSDTEELIEYDDFFDFISTDVWKLILTFILSCGILFIGFIFGKNEIENTSNGFYFSIFIAVMILVIYFSVMNSKYNKNLKALKEQKKKEEEEKQEEIYNEEFEILQRNSVCNRKPNICIHGGKCVDIDVEKETYMKGKDQQFYLNPDIQIIHEEILEEDMRTAELEENTSESEYCDDY